MSLRAWWWAGMTALESAAVEAFAELAATSLSAPSARPADPQLGLASPSDRRALFAGFARVAIAHR